MLYFVVPELLNVSLLNGFDEKLEFQFPRSDFRIDYADKVFGPKIFIIQN